MFEQMTAEPSTPPSPARPLPAAAIAFGVGLAGDLLLRAMPWGVNIALWAALLVGGVIWLMRRERPQPAATIIFAASGALLAAMCIIWRDSDALVLLDLFVLAVFLVFLSFGGRGVVVWSAGIARIVGAGIFTALLALPGMFQLLLADIRWKALAPGRAGGRVLTVVKGIVIALPLLLIFGGLLSSGDAAFSSLLSNLFNFDMPQIVGHIVATIILTFVTAGFLRSTLWGPALPNVDRPAFLHLGGAEVNIAVGLIDLMFAAFVAVQFRYFFGGAALVRVAPKLTYAEYARHGFFELVAVAAIVVPVLLVAEWIMDSRDTRAVRAFRILAVVQVLCVGVMLVSAYRRMQLYVDEFGLTESRVYTTAFMFWLAAVLLWFVATVLTGHRERFVIGAVVSGVITILTLHAINPDERIVATNVARAAAGKRVLDATYATSLSADAAPSLLSAVQLLPPCGARRMLANDAEWGDWRSWNVSRARAHAAIDANRGALVALAHGCGTTQRD